MIPSGYEKLATIGILYRGEYSPDEQYKFLSAVYHSGSTYVALKDNPSGAPAGDGVNWQYMAKGFVEGVLSAVNAQDTAGVLGTAGKTVNSQTLVDAIADKVMTKLLQKNKILQTVEQVMASKDADNVTGAAATAELNRKLTYADVTNSIVLNHNCDNILMQLDCSSNHVNLSFDILAKSDISWGTTVLSIPTNYAPKNGKYFPIIKLNSHDKIGYGVLYGGGIMYLDSLKIGEYAIANMSWNI